MDFQFQISESSLKAQLSQKTGSRRKAFAASSVVAAAAAAAMVKGNDLLPSLVIGMRDIGGLSGAKRPVRKSEQVQLAQVVRTIGEFGFVAPILITAHGEIVDGHVRLSAARELGLKQVPCLIVDHLQPLQIRGLRIALNRTQETGSWDLEALALEVGELSGFDFDLTTLGFTPEQLDITALGDDGSREVDQLPLPSNAIPIVGDVFRAGKHLVLCGDATQPSSYATVLEGGMADAVFTDPPWNLDASFIGGKGKKKHTDFVMASGEMTDAALAEMFKQFMSCCFATLSDGAPLYACIDWRHEAMLIASGLAAGFAHINTIIWNKGSGAMGGLYRSAHEFIPLFCKGAAPAVNNIKLGKHGRDRTNVWSYPGASSRGSSASKALKYHPTPKPVSMVADALLDVTSRGSIVMDPFLGSGTTLLAAQQTGRVARCIELDPQYVEVALRRWEASTGKKVLHASSGLTLEELQASRAANSAAA